MMTEAERKRSKVAGALAGFRMGKAPDRSGEKQVGDEAFYKRQHEKGQELGAIAKDVSGWNAWKRLMSTPYDTLMGNDADAVGRAGLDAAQVAGTAMGGGAMIPAEANSLRMGIKAYHGSPHSFDKFSMDKIGTGEGAQAYGHGLYFAENEGVAKGYRDTLAKDVVSMDGAAIPHDAPGADTIYRLANHMNQMGQSVNEVIADAVSRAQKLSGDLNSTDHYKQSAAKAAADWANAVLPYGGKSLKWGRDPGSMYEVNINADPNAFLDWDKPLNEQPKNVQDAFAKMDPEQYLPNSGDYDPSELGQISYNRMLEQFHLNRQPAKPYLQSKADITGKLNKAGIPGIKYLDAGSRGAGDGTRNYVVFDDKLVSIVKKYGIAGASAMLGYNVLDGVTNAQAEELKKASGGGRIGGLAKQNQEQPNAY